MNDKTNEHPTCGAVELPQRTAALEVREHDYKRIEAALKESENRYTSLLELTPDGILVLDIETRELQYANPAICKLLGYTKEELKKMDMRKFHPVEALHYVRSEIEAQARGEKTLVQEIPFLKKDGTVFYADINATKVLINGRECLLGYFRDVTEQKETKKALEKSERLYRMLAENVSDVIWTTDMNLRFTYVSPSVTQFLGYGVEEAMAKKVEEMLTPSSFRVAMEAFAEALSREKSEQRNLSKARTLELEQHCKDGSTVWAEVKMSFLRDEDGQAFGILGVSRDISKRKQAEEALRESEEKYRSVVDNIGIGVVLISPTMKILTLNQQMKKWFPHIDDVTKKPICYQSFNNPPREEVCSYCPTYKTLKDGEIHEAITDTPAGDTIKHYRVVSSPIKDREGNVIAAIEMAEDITERLRVEQALRESEEFAFSLLNNSPDPILVINPDTSIRYANPALEKTTGFTLAELMGKTPPYPWWPEETSPKIRKVFEETFHKGVRGLEELLQRKNGERFWVEITATPIESNGKFKYFLANWVDTTQRKQAEEALQKAYNELERRVEERTVELAKANEQLKQEIEERKRVEEALQESFEKLKLFAYSVSHDLKNPAIGIHGLTKLLHKQYADILEERGRNYCSQIVKASEQVASLVEKINVYITTKEAPLTIENVKLKEILRMVREEFSTQLNIRQIKWSESEFLPEIKGDRMAILRVLRNLIDNALKYGGDKLSEIKIGYKEDGDFHVLSVNDDGVGIKQEASKKIFGLFKRYETSRGIEGTGLGLAIVKEIAAQHGGQVWAEPDPKKGITFCVSISKFLL